MADIVSASAGIAGSLPTIASCIGKFLGSLASFNYQLVTSIFKGITDCCKVLYTVCTNLFGAFGEIFQYLGEVFAECGNVIYAFVRLGSTFFHLICHIIYLVICGIVCIGEGVAACIATCLRVCLLAIGKAGSNVASVLCYVKSSIAEVAPEYVDSITLTAGRFTTVVNNSLQHGAKCMAATAGAILGAAYESMSITARDFWQLATEWCICIAEVAIHSTTVVVLYVKSCWEYVALAIHKHVNVDCYMFFFLATTVFISVKVLLDYMNKRDLTIPLPGFRRQARIRIRNRRNFATMVPSIVLDSSDEEIFEDDEFDYYEESEEVSVTTSDIDEFDESDSVTHEEYEVGSDDSDDSLESEGGTSVQIQLPPPGGYNLRTRRKSPSPSHSAGASSDVRSEDEEEINRKCVVCQDQPKTVLVLPCKHMCLCVDCAHTIASLRSRFRRVCPLCRGRIQTVMNVYL